MSKTKSKKKVEKRIKIIGMVLSLAIILVAVVSLVYKAANNNRISFVTKKLSAKYDDVKCINASCDGIMAVQNKKKKDVVRIYNSKGNLVAKYKEKDSGKIKAPYEIKKDYFLKKTTESDGKEVSSSIHNLNGKELYSSSNPLTALSNYFILMQKQGNIGDVYTLINKDGKELYSNISEIENYNDEYVYIKIDKDYFILNNKGKKLLEGYKIVREVKENDKSLYLVVKEDNNDLYYYFDVKDGKIVGEGFNDYKIQKDNTIRVTKKENDTTVNYIVKTNGKQEELDEADDYTNAINTIKSKIDSKKYLIYPASVTSSKQKNVLVDNLANKSIGILNLSSNKFKKLYDYSSNKFYSTINVLESLDDNLYLQISCTENVCNNNKMVVYNMTENKEIFKNEGNDKVAQNYVQFKNGYKVFKFNHSSKDEKYKGKYVLYDDNNKELAMSTNEINVIDSEIVLGNVSDKSIVLYVSSRKKQLNNENESASKLDIKNNNYYQYKKGNDNIIVDSNGKKIYSINNGKLEYNDENIFAITNKLIKIYNMKTEEINIYKFEKNESLNNISNKNIKPFKNTIFVNNSDDNYIKVVNSKGKVIKTIKDSVIKSVEYNEKEKKAYIVTKKDVDSKIKFGLYIAK